jgi:DNA methylase
METVATKRAGVGTALNAICPYFTMFPLSFPHRILKRYGKFHETVLDPFCGRGTTNYAARLLGYESYGFDSSPVAIAATKAKLANVSPTQILNYATRLLEANMQGEVPQGEFWEAAYDRTTLDQVCRLRTALLSQQDASQVSHALTGIILGALHGPSAKFDQSYLSNQCPRTYAPKPNSAVNFWRKRQLTAPRVEVLDIIKKRAERYYGQRIPKTMGSAFLADSRQKKPFSYIKQSGDRVSWVITSPPYYGLRTYIPDQWIRNWFVGGPAVVDYSADRQLSHGGLESFIKDLNSVWGNARKVAKSNARMVVRFGAIKNRELDSPFEVIRDSLLDTGWEVTAVRSAGTASEGRRQALGFGQRGQALAEIDVWARAS